jgi:hypothetical protein
MYVSELVWNYVAILQATKSENIVWRDNLHVEDIWLLPVDGTHFWIKEPSHNELSQGKNQVLPQTKQAGKLYELGWRTHLDERSIRFSSWNEVYKSSEGESWIEPTFGKRN